MKHFILLTVFILLSSSIFGQDENPQIRKNSVYLELLGNGVVYSLNYERIFTDNKVKPFVRIGGNEMHFDGSDTLRFYFVSEAGVAIGRSKNLLDLSLGYTHPLTKLDKDRLFFIRVGIRYSGPGGLVIRFAPLYAINSLKGDVFNGFWLGLAIGYSF